MPTSETPARTACDVVRTALAQYGITIDQGLTRTTAFGSSLDITVPLPDSKSAHLVIADRDYSLDHEPAAHTGWSVSLHKERGQALGGPIYLAGYGGLVDCAADSTAVSTFAADFLTEPRSRHCDCYSQERYGRWHDVDCNRYARPAMPVRPLLPEASTPV